MPATQPTSYGNYRSTAIIESLQVITVISKCSRACAGHCLVLFKIKDERKSQHMFTSDFSSTNPRYKELMCYNGFMDVILLNTV